MDFQYGSKKIKHQHIDNQMCPVGMKKGVENQPGILTAFKDLIGIELVFIDQAMLTESNDGKNRSDQNDDYGHSCN
jgi:hypothetical protein